MAEVKLIQTESLENDLVVEGEFASEKTMESWGWSKSFILTLALINFCLSNCTDRTPHLHQMLY